MTDQISPEMFAHLVELAALELETGQAEYLRGELNHQLKAIDELAAIPLDDSVPIAAHGVPFTPAISPAPRPDEVQPGGDPAEILAQAPEESGGYIIVPDIPHTTLE